MAGTRLNVKPPKPGIEQGSCIRNTVIHQALKVLAEGKNKRTKHKVQRLKRGRQSSYLQVILWSPRKFKVITSKPI